MFGSCRSVQADESMQSGDETTSAGDAGPSSSSGVKMPPNNTTATALNNDDALTQLEPNIGSKINDIFSVCVNQCGVAFFTSCVKMSFVPGVTMAKYMIVIL